MRSFTTSWVDMYDQSLRHNPRVVSLQNGYQSLSIPECISRYLERDQPLSSVHLFYCVLGFPLLVLSKARPPQ